MRSLAGPLDPFAWLLSNGRYHVLVSGAGGGQSRWKELALSRWRGDAEDDQGFFVYLRDLESGGFWSAGKHPVRGEDAVQAAYTDGSVTLSRAHDGVESQLQIAVSSEDDVEVRRLRLQNASGRRRRIEVTSYFEVVLNYAGADAAHPAFSKLFVETEVAGSERILLARRRPRGNDEHWPCLFHVLTGARAAAWETDRMRFFGRGGTPARPAALVSREELSGAAGNVLDPIASLRTIVDLDVGGAAELGFLVGIAPDREAALATARGYRDASRIERAFASAREAERGLCNEVGITPQQAERFQAIGGAMSYASRSLRAARARLEPSSNVDDTFGRLRVPRDRPTIVARLDWSDADLGEIVAARKYWGGKGLYTNLVVISSNADAKQPAGLDDRVFTPPAADVAARDLDHLLVAAHLVLGEESSAATAPRAQTAGRPAASGAAATKAAASRRESLQSWNGFGGFSADGSEYVVALPWQESDLRRPPLPWINVVANENAGFLVSECGAGYTWARNSQANRLTPWSNDPVSDPHGEAFYLRDEETGEVWSPAPGPAPAPCDYQARHGFGETRFLCTHRDIELETSFFVPHADPVRIVHLRITNHGAKPRRLAVYSYQRLVLGGAPELPSLILTEHDAARDLLLAHTCKGSEFRGTAVFSAAITSGAQPAERSFTCDRAAFLGPEGNVSGPAAVRAGAPLGGEAGAGLDPCFAQRVSFTLAAQATAECALLLGESPDAKAAGGLVEKYRAPGAIAQARDEARSFWRSLLSGLRVETPSPAIDLMVNGWLPYQVLACRMWARSAFFQSGGAFGYRDQLQDAAALLHLRPELTRAQILLHARHQFAEGDVMHWWHPDPIGRGLRTRFSDDLLWLPYLTCVYVDTTGDEAILAEVEPFLKARLLADGEDEAYLGIEHSGEGDLYEHCCRAIDKSLTRGPHGIPLMGTGDWNDGMNRVGREGKGESIWLGFFLHHVIDLFRPICRRRGDHTRDDRYASYAADIAKALNGAGWDGEWYRRAYYDDGTPLGTANDTECRIDAIAQAWAVISGVAPPDKANAAMDAAEKHLISEKDGIIRLLTPAFVNTPHDPGYIKGYVAGVRENGGQYTHGACWVVRAMAEIGRHERAARLLEMISPVSHARSEERALRYKLEPYVIGADVYGEPPHVGRGGWSWYTGSAAWMYRIALESILGFRIEGGKTLVIEPRVPDDWPGYRIAYRHPPSGAVYEIAVENPGKSARGIQSVELDGRKLPATSGPARIPLATDAEPHSVKLVLG